MDKAFTKRLAKGEYDAERAHASVAKDFPEVAGVQQDEKKHGDRIAELIKLL